MSDKIPVGTKFYSYRQTYNSQFPELVESIVTGGGEVYTNLSFRTETGRTGTEKVNVYRAAKLPRTPEAAKESQLDELYKSIREHEAKIEWARAAIAHLTDGWDGSPATTSPAKRRPDRT